MKDAYWLTNVRLETGWIREGGQVTGTETGLFHILVAGKEFAEMIAADQKRECGLPVYDCQGSLMVPAFEEAHIHLDKTYFGGPWKAVRPVSGLGGRIKEERHLLPELLPTCQQQAEHILHTLQQYGTAHVRAHCNIEQVSGLRRLEATRQAFDTYRGRLSGELVAFPQHGLLGGDVPRLMKEAMSAGATHVGGLDPAGVDGDVEKSLNLTFELATAHNADIDIHLHEAGEAGERVLTRIADLTEDAGLQGRVTVSHAFWFAGADPSEAEEMAGRLGSLGISVASTVPIGRRVMPLPMLSRNGVRVKLGTDSLTDHWSPFGNGDQLEKAGRYAELYGCSDEMSLARTLQFITGGRTPLSEDGKKIWPRPGDAATCVLVGASCSAEAVARRSARKAVLFEGEQVVWKFNSSDDSMVD